MRGRGLPGRKVRASSRRLTRTGPAGFAESGRSSGVEHNLAKVGVEGSNPFARSSFPAISSLGAIQSSLYAARMTKLALVALAALAIAGCQKAESNNVAEAAANAAAPAPAAPAPE